MGLCSPLRWRKPQPKPPFTLNWVEIQIWKCSFKNVILRIYLLEETWIANARGVYNSLHIGLRNYLLLKARLYKHYLIWFLCPLLMFNKPCHHLSMLHKAIFSSTDSIVTISDQNHRPFHYIQTTFILRKHWSALQLPSLQLKIMLTSLPFTASSIANTALILSGGWWCVAAMFLDSGNELRLIHSIQSWSYYFSL